jgi:hypothetical protein
MKPLLTLLIIALLSVVASACGGAGAGKGTSSPSQTLSNTASAATGRGLNDSNDGDNVPDSKNNTENNDDREVEYYGHAANAADKGTATAFAKRYFAAAAADDGATACSLLVPNLAKAIPRSYGKAPNPTYVRGKTCAEVMSKLFNHRHRRMVAEAARLEVTSVRIAHETAFILLAFRTIPERRYMGVKREGDTWKLEALLDSEYP